MSRNIQRDRYGRVVRRPARRLVLGMAVLAAGAGPSWSAPASAGPASPTTWTVSVPVPNYSVDAATVMADGGILALVTTQSPQAVQGPAPQALVRLAPGGHSLDSSFGHGGVVSLPDVTNFVTVDSQDRILVLGTPTTQGSAPTVRRFLPTGQPDASFGQGGLWQ